LVKGKYGKEDVLTATEAFMDNLFQRKDFLPVCRKTSKALNWLSNFGVGGSRCTVEIVVTKSMAPGIFVQIAGKR